MSFILNIDTSSLVCSVCLSKDGTIIAERNDISGNAHAAMLSPMITSLLQEADIDKHQLSAIAVSHGPGSYTGLRIGASLAKGLCYGLDIPLIAVPTLQAMADHMTTLRPDQDGLYVAMADARRQDAYVAVCDRMNNIILDTYFCTVDRNFIDDLLNFQKNLYFGGPASTKARHLINFNFGTIIENVSCFAANMARISDVSFENRSFENVTYYTPFYLKEFEGNVRRA